MLANDLMLVRLRFYFRHVLFWRSSCLGRYKSGFDSSCLLYMGLLIRRWRRREENNSYPITVVIQHKPDLYHFAV